MANHFSALKRAKQAEKRTLVNRMHLWPGGDAPPESLGTSAENAGDIALLAAALAKAAGDSETSDHEAEARAAVAAASDYAEQARMDIESTEGLRADALRHQRFFRRVPELPRDVHDLAGLVQIRRYLFQDDGPAAELEGGAALASAHDQEA